MAIHPSVGAVARVQHKLRHADGSIHVHGSDLIFVAGAPQIVLEWNVLPGGDRPALALSIDPALLERTAWNPNEYLYHGLVEDPRKLP